METLIKHFDAISHENTFNKPCRLTYDYSTKRNEWDYPLWFNSNSFQTLGAWIVSNFEKTIWMNYYQSKRNTPRDPFLKIEQILHLDSRKKLVDFWKECDSSRKNKVNL